MSGPALSEVGKALGHPLRVRIIERALVVDEVSAARLAREFDEPVGVVSYHVRELVKRGVLLQGRIAQVRGAMEHFYVRSPVWADRLRPFVQGRPAKHEPELWVNEARTVLVTRWPSGQMEVALREEPAAVWGPPVPVRADR